MKAIELIKLSKCKAHILTLLLFSVLWSYSQDHQWDYIHKFTFKNRVVEVDSINFIDSLGVKQGKWFDRDDENHSITIIGRYKDGLREGEWIGYDENGNEKKIIKYLNGKDISPVNKSLKSVSVTFGSEAYVPFVLTSISFYVGTNEGERNASSEDSDNTHFITNQVSVAVYRMVSNKKVLMDTLSSGTSHKIDSIKLLTNSVYILHCSRKGYIDREIEVSTPVMYGEDSVAFEMSFINLGFYNKFIPELSPDIFGKYSKRFYYFDVTKKIQEDVIYYYYYVNKFNQLDSKTKDELIKDFDNKFNPEILGLKELNSQKEKEIAFQHLVRNIMIIGLILLLTLAFIIYRSLQQNKKDKKIIEQQKQMVDEAFKHLEEKNKEVMDSITYAQRIQKALITSELYIEKQLNRLINGG